LVKRAVLCGYYGMGNGGDEALLATLLHMLPSHIQPIVLSKTPAATAQRYNVEAIDRWNAWQVLQALRRSQVFIWGGGSLIQDSSSAISPLYYLGLMKLSQMLGLKTIAWAQGIGPIRRPWIQTLTAWALQQCATVSVRDRGSSELLTRWGVAHTLAPDPVWAMEQRMEKSAAERPLTIAINLRQHHSLTPERLALLTQAFVQLQQNTGAKILLVPFQASLDLALAQELQGQLGDGSEVVQLDDPVALRQLFEQVDVAIVMRLHALIMAAAAGCRCFALSYDPKVTQVATSLNLPIWQVGELSEDVGYLVTTLVDVVRSGRSLAMPEQQQLADQAKQHQKLLQQVM
jgi:polysaccharide pyruvyl transferase CsaB